MSFIKNLFNKIKNTVKKSEKNDWEDKALILSAKSLMNSEIWRRSPDFHNPKWIQEKGFSVYSQFDDDGIIQYLIYYLNLNQKDGQFIEFGVGD